MPKTSLAIQRTGLVTSVGLSAPAACAAIRAKITNPTETRFIDSSGQWIMAHEVPLEKPWRGLSKLARMAAMAIEECLEDIPQDTWRQIPLLLCVAEQDRPGRLAGLDDQLFIDIGAKDRAEAMETYGIALGDPITPVSSYTPLTNPDLVLCKAFDNRVGCGVMIESMLRLRDIPLPCTLTAVGTVQEELGCRGAITASALLQPDVALILEGTPADDTPGMDASESQGALGSGPQLRLLDPTALMNRPLVDLVEKVAQENGLPCQIAVRRSGGTDAKSIHLAGIVGLVTGSHGNSI